MSVTSPTLTASTFRPRPSTLRRSTMPSVAWSDDVSTKVALVAMHLLAAAIIVPVLVRYAND